ncbi:MAG: hypothetical protein K2N38_12190 [Oscillospiraceae bacterium]|nr:hypothetical protein [Oscillospiraceae bacterium]
MDKRDFYRELMEKYAFDKDKIYTNAKNGKYIGNKRSRLYPLYIGMTAAVAAVAVTVGTLTTARIGKTPNVIDPRSGDSSVASLSGKEASDVNAHNDPSIVGDSSSESSVDNTSDRVAPIIANSDPIGDTSGESSQIPDIGSGNENSSLPDNSTESSSSTAPETSSATQSGTSEPVEPSVNNVSSNITEVDGILPGEITLPDDSESLPISVDVMIALPENAVLPFNPDRFMYLTEDIGARQAYFLNDNTLYVRTAGDIRLYTVNGGEPILSASRSCGDVTTFWIAENGGRQLAYDSGKLYDVNADNGTVTENILDVQGQIVEIAYNENMKLLALNVFDNGNYDLIVYENGFTNAKTIYSSASEFSLVAANKGYGDIGNGSVFIAECSEDGTLIYKVTLEGEASVISTVQGKYDITKNAAFTHAVFDGELTAAVFDPESFGMATVNNFYVKFGISKHSFLGSDGWYTIDDGSAVPSGGVPVIASLDFRRSLSRIYLAAAENGAVRIVDGIYTDRARNDDLTFDAIEENAPTEMRMAVNAAVGLQNALSGMLCESIGIVDTETFDGLVKACFSESAGAMLKLRSAVGEGETLTYSGGAFYPINLSDTVLVINEKTENTANGTLYINAGSFGGRTAYYSCTVKLQKTENGYVADCIIE